MSRYLAICEAPNITEEQFRDKFDRIRKWRPTRRTWVLKAYCSTDQGSVVVECESPEKAPFEEWLANTGWKVNTINDISFIHESGSVWPMR